MANDSEITKVRLIIRHFLWQTRDVVRSAEESQKWLRQFRDTLEFQELEENPNAYALAIIAEARSFNDQKKRNGQMKWVRASLEKEGFKNPTEEQLAERWMLMYGQENSPQDAPNGNAGVDMSDAHNTFTADGDIREDSQAKPDGSAITRNETRAHDALEPSANHYGPRQAKNGDAATREGADESTTVSRNMRRVPQNEAPAHGFSGGRTAQGTMSRSPEAAAQSGKDYDQAPAKTRDTREDSRGRYAPPSCSPEDGNPAETAPSHGGSVASLEARQSQAWQSQAWQSQGRAGANAPKGGRTSQSHSAPARPQASFRNKEAFIQWAIDDGLDPVDAGECWAATEERGGKDADGNTVKNMKAFARQWCRTRANNRRTA